MTTRNCSTQKSQKATAEWVCSSGKGWFDLLHNKLTSQVHPFNIDEFTLTNITIIPKNNRMQVKIFFFYHLSIFFAF